MSDSVSIGSASNGRALVRLGAILAACAALLVASLAVAGPADALRKGPKGERFYKPSKKLIKKKKLYRGGHGKLVWQRNAIGAVKPTSAAWTKRVLYLTKNFRTGKSQPVSGTVSVPKGTAPEGGWPLVTWGHGTTGLADQCAPSKVKKVTTDYIGYQDASINAMLDAGYAVAQTDYEGLGTAGIHPYLVGASEGRSMLDIVTVARKLSSKIGDEYAIAGHSQGGHAALFAADEANDGYLGSGEELVGTIGYAPAARLDQQAENLLTADETHPLFGQPSGLSGLVAMIVRGASVARPADINVKAILKGKARRLAPKIDTLCSSELGSSKYFGSIAPYEMIDQSPGTGEGIAALTEVLLDEMSPSQARSGAPILILQGTTDTTVLPILTDILVDDLAAGGNNLNYLVYNGLDHGEIVTDGDPKQAALDFLQGIFNPTPP